jgi:hypothetical protein
MKKNTDKTSQLRRRFWVAPGGWNHELGRDCAVFIDVDLARQVATLMAKRLPPPFRSLWEVVPVHELDLLAELKARRNRGYNRLRVVSGLNPDGSLRGFTFDLEEIINADNFLMGFRKLAEITDNERAMEEGQGHGDEV